MGIKVSLVPSLSGVKILGIVNVFSSHSLSTKTESFAEHSNSLVLVALTHPVSEMLVVSPDSPVLHMISISSGLSTDALVVSPIKSHIAVSC